MVTVGRIARAHGVRGEVAVDVRTDAPERRFTAGSVLTVERPARDAAPANRRMPSTLTVARARWHHGRLLVVFDGVADRDTAETLRGSELQVEIADDESPTDADEYYDHQLVGLRVVTADGDHIGDVTEIVHGPSQDVLVVSRPNAPAVLVPFVAEIVPDVDVGAGRIVVDPPPGLLDLHRSGEAAT